MRGQELLAVEREQIMIGVARDESCRVIAGRLGRDHTVVSREIARNGGRESYRASAAQERAVKERRRRKPRKLEENPELHDVVAGGRWTGHRATCPSGCGGIILRTGDCGSLPTRSLTRWSSRPGVRAAPSCAGRCAAGGPDGCRGGRLDPSRPCMTPLVTMPQVH